MPLLSTIGIQIILTVLNLLPAQADISAYSLDNKRMDFEDLPLHLGNDIQLYDYNGLRGLLVVAWPENPCESINSPPPLPPPQRMRDTASFAITPLPFIILINGSDCNFYKKVLSAEEAGYQAAIIHNVDSKDFIRLDSKDVRKQINIPTLFVTEETAISLKEAYTYDKGAQVVLSIYSLFFTYLIIVMFTIMPVCVIIFPFIAVLLMSNCVLNRLMLKRLPVHTHKEGDTPYDTCAICLEDYVEGEKLRVLPCRHAYHTWCVDHWLTTMKKTCPVCIKCVEVCGGPKAPCLV